jgi:hypothetical protein
VTRWPATPSIDTTAIRVITIDDMLAHGEVIPDP